MNVNVIWKHNEFDRIS